MARPVLRLLLLASALASALAALLVGAAGASAAPINDQLVNATWLPSSGSQSFTATTLGASTEFNEPDLATTFRTVWFSWTPAATGGTYLAGCPDDAEIAVYTGSSIATLKRISYGGGKCAGDAKWVAKAGVTYRIRVNADTVAAGSVATIKLKQVTATPNAAMLATPAVTALNGRLTFRETTGAEGPLIDDCDIDGKMAFCYPEGDHFLVYISSTNGLTDGTHTFHITFRDFYGNVDPTPLAYTWKIDATPPQTTLVGQPDPLSGTPLLTFASSEPNSTFVCRLDSATWVPCASPWTMSVAPGFHGVAVRAIDAVGNVDVTEAWTNWNRKVPATPSPPVTIIRPPLGGTPGGATSTAKAPAPSTPTVPVPAPAAGCRVAVARPETVTRRLLRDGMKLKVTTPVGCRWTVVLRRVGTTKALATATGLGGPPKAATLKVARRAAAKIAARSRLELVAQAVGAAGPVKSIIKLTVRR
jgi:hypothetical protein